MRAFDACPFLMKDSPDAAQTEVRRTVCDLRKQYSIFIYFMRRGDRSWKIFLKCIVHRTRD